MKLVFCLAFLGFAAFALASDDYVASPLDEPICEEYTSLFNDVKAQCFNEFHHKNQTAALKGQSGQLTAAIKSLLRKRRGDDDAKNQDHHEKLGRALECAEKLVENNQLIDPIHDECKEQLGDDESSRKDRYHCIMDAIKAQCPNTVAEIEAKHADKKAASQQTA